jgi:hypothetical protein
MSTLAVPAAAAPNDGDKVSICHRTGAKPVNGFFPGHIITVSTDAAADHVVDHGDVLLFPGAEVGRSGKRAICVIDLSGKAFASDGKQIGGVIEEGPGGGDPGGPG